MLFVVYCSNQHLFIILIIHIYTQNYQTKLTKKTVYIYYIQATKATWSQDTWTSYDIGSPLADNIIVFTNSTRALEIITISESIK